MDWLYYSNNSRSKTYKDIDWWEMLDICYANWCKPIWQNVKYYLNCFHYVGEMYSYLFIWDQKCENLDVQTLISLRITVIVWANKLD